MEENHIEERKDFEDSQPVEGNEKKIEETSSEEKCEEGKEINKDDSNCLQTQLNGIHSHANANDTNETNADESFSPNGSNRFHVNGHTPSTPTTPSSFTNNENGSNSSSSSSPSSSSPSNLSTNAPSSGDQKQGEIESKGQLQKKLIIKFLPTNMVEEQLKSLFDSYGKVESCKIIKEYVSQKSLGYGFIEYDNHLSAKKAADELNGKDVGGKNIRVELAHPNPTSPSAQRDKATNLHNSGIPPHHSKAESDSSFEGHGKNTSSRISDRNANQNRGGGNFRMEHHENSVKGGSGGGYGPVRRTNNVAPYSPYPTSRPPAHTAYPQRPTAPAPVAVTGTPRVPPPPIPYLAPYPPPPVAYHPTPYVYPPQYPYYPPPPPPTSIRSGTVPVPTTATATVAPTATAYDPYQLAYDPNQFYAQPYIDYTAYAQAVQPVVPASAQSPDGGVTLFVFHLPSDMTEDAMRELFGQHGQIISTRIVCDKETGANKGYGFVTYTNAQDAQNAITAMDGYQIANKHLRVSFKREKGANNASNSATTTAVTTASTATVQPLTYPQPLQYAYATVQQ